MFEKYEVNEDIELGSLSTPERLANCAGHRVAFDTETTGLNPWHDELLGIGYLDLDTGDHGYLNTAIYGTEVIGVRKQREVIRAYKDPLAASLATEAMAEVFAHEDSQIIGHNLKFDAHFVKQNMYESPATFHDTITMCHLLDSSMKKSMDVMENTFLGSDSKRVFVEAAAALVPKAFKKKVYRWPLDATRVYCVNDVLVTAQLAQVLYPALGKMHLQSLYEMDMRFLATVQQIEIDGFQIDPEYVEKAAEQLGKNHKVMLDDFYDIIGYPINVNSHKQLSKAIYEGLGIPKPKSPYPEGSQHPNHKLYGSTCTNKALLAEISHPLAIPISDIRETAKLKNNVEKWALLADDANRVHPSFNINGTKTGRLSCSNPNLQNIPSGQRKRKNDEVSEFSGGTAREGEYNLRQSFVAADGHTLVKLDHRQQEIRIFGVMANDPNMLPLLATGEDIHMSVALAVWGDLGPEVNKVRRQWAKEISFGLLYGMSSAGLAQRLGVDMEEADRITSGYWERFPRIRPWLSEAAEKMEELGYVRTWSGRIWRERNPNLWYRGANSAIQGGAADLMKIATMRCMKIVKRQGWGAIVDLVHDEDVFEIKNEVLDEAIHVMAKTLEVEDLFGIPFVADASIGKNYGQLEDYPLTQSTLDSIDWQEYTA